MRPRRWELLPLAATLVLMLSGCSATVLSVPPGLAITGIGLPMAGTTGAQADETAEMAAITAALVDLGLASPDSKMLVTTRVSLASLKTHSTFRGMLPGPIGVASDAWSDLKAKLPDILHSVDLLVEGSNLPVRLVVHNSVFVAPAPPAIQARDVRAAVERAGFGVETKSRGGGVVEATLTTPGPRPADCDGAVSGLVIDAREVDLRPAMAPKVLGERGQEVYGPSVVNRNWVIQQGMAGYSPDFEKAVRHERVGSNPLIVKAVAVSGDNRSAVVAAKDAGAIRAAFSRCPEFLQQARVLFVVRPRE